MSITNRSSLPEALIKAMANDPYDAGASDFTVTGLLKPARIVVLEARHAHELTEDAEDGLYRLYGQLVHTLLERANENDLAEKRYFAEFRVGGRDYQVSGQMDNLTLSSGTLRDYKFTTAYGFKTGKPAKPEYVAQLNMLAELMRMNGETRVQSLEIIGLLRDWQKRDAKYTADYPQAPVAIQPLPMWSSAQTQAFIKMRIAAHVDARTNLPECDPTEMWQRENVWAVVKKGGKRAINGGVQLSEESAKAVQAKNAGTEIVFRAGERVRCADYCRVGAAGFCTQFERSKNENENETQNEKEDAI